MKIKCLAIAIFIATSSTALADNSELADKLNSYKINQKYRSSFVANPEHHKAGVKWNTNGSCGDFDMDFSIGNTLSSGDMQRMLDNWIRQAKNAFDPASLIALALQRANPDLYEILQNGLIEAKGIYENDLNMCESIQGEILDAVPSGWIEKITVNEEYTKKISEAYSSLNKTDINAVNSFKGESGDKGFTILGTKFGGEGQPDASIVELVAIAGTNIAADRLERGSITKIDVNNVSILNVDVDEYPFTKHFTKPSDVSTYIVNITGETKVTTRDGSDSITHTKAAGLIQTLQKSEKSFYLKLDEIVDYAEHNGSNSAGDLSRIMSNVDDFNKDIIGSYLTVPMVQELAAMNSHEKSIYKRSLANEYAFKQVMDRTFTARRILLLGSKEASIYDAKPIYDIAEEKIEFLDKEIDILEREYRIRKLYSNNTAEKLFLKAAKSQNKGVIVTSGQGIRN